MKLSDELLEIAARHDEELDALWWASEEDRWAELLFCILNAFVDDPWEARELTSALRSAGVTEPSVLAKASDPSSEVHTVLGFVLQRHGLGAEEARRAIGVLAGVGAAVENRYDSKIQLYLRQQAESMRDDLVALFADSKHSDDSALYQGVTHWLQNAVGMPLSAADGTVREFCREREVSQAELEQAADEINLNLALLDDVIRADYASKEVKLCPDLGVGSNQS